ncbi:TIR domain-containing protein [Nitrosomonas europaea]|uniref:TIR domain-containing protein n=1 Tax=Nitrosomonas europaea TaxID=915 RepID=UPI00059ECCCA|nr:TIR domain-containing protein [Nitrosomonas europaea]SDW97801.1 MTH538 TIR-like domain [Nitrosomonas europaea]SET50621.1 MTH538 TIR-like domain [Nitrosomonas europaea]SKA05611.1 MTH538 TIR-like domain [Nitrosomonas europaea]
MARKCFYSFHYQPDNWRASTVRQIGAIEGNQPAKDNDWESIASGANQDEKIKRWIAEQMQGRTCTIVLVGTSTANRKWINHEIVKSWNDGLGVVGIRIHGLKDRNGNTSAMGKNPFDHITHGPSKKPLSSLVKCYNPAGATSQDRYAWIAQHLENAVAEAIRIRKANS